MYTHFFRSHNGINLPNGNTVRWKSMRQYDQNYQGKKCYT